LPNRIPICTSSPSPGYGSDRSSTPSTTPNIVVVAPTPSAIVASAAIVKSGARTKARTA
jgi:hypothetical protein